MEGLPVMEQFLSIQGEGAHQGRAAWFIRLGGCDVGCVWCDVKESWDVTAHPVVSVTEILAGIPENFGGIVVITGGEPLLYDLTELTRGIREKGLPVHLETSGTHPLTGTWDWICWSPKKFRNSLTGIPSAAHELKVVVYNQSDFAWAELHRAQVTDKCRLFLQPEWSKSTVMLPMLISYVQENPDWHISLQTHKYMQIP